MERTLFGFIWRYSRRQQIVILALTVISFPILYMTLELPKWIVNDAITGDAFPVAVLGFELGQVSYLLALCLAFLGLVVLNNIVKYALNIYKGIAGERMLRRLRYMLYHHILRFPLTRFRKVSGGEIIPMITAEVEDVGVFIGEAIATPAFQGGTLLVYIVFIFAQDPFLGAAAISLYPFQAYIIPKLQKRVILLTRDRIKNVRVISDRINETVSAAADIKTNDTGRYHLADLSDRLFLNYRIRLAIFKRKFMIKFINNFLNQLPPFFFYSVGGYLVITGDLTFGALVAVLAAYKDLANPWKELLNWYQNLANVSVKYQTVVENFDVEDILAPDKVDGDGAEVALDNLDIRLENLSATSGGSGQAVTDVTLAIPHGTRLAVYGGDGSGRSELILAATGLIPPATGRATLGGRRIADLSNATLARHISFVGPDPYVFNDTIRGNVVYGLKTRPRGEPDDDLAPIRRTEAMLTGNSLLDATVPWEDYERAGVDDPDRLDQRLLDLFELVGLEQDLYRLGLAAHLDESLEAEFADRIVAARAEVARRVAEDREWAGLVELWSSGRFNNSGTIGENTLFALPRDPSAKVWELGNDPKVRAALEEAGVLDLLVETGVAVATTMIELFANTGADASLIGDYSFVSADELPLFEQRLRRRTQQKDGKRLSDEDTAAFVNLAFRLVPGRHRIVTLSEADQARLVAARDVVHRRLEGDERYALFDEKRYLSPLSIEENLLFGKARVDRRGASDRIDGFLRETVRELGLRDTIARAGLDFRVGVAGGRLSASQRRRIGLVRALVKRPDILIIDGVADGDRALATRLLDAVADGTFLVGTADPQVARAIGTVAVLREGRLVATGGWDSVQQIAIEGVSEDVLQREAS